MSTLINRQPGDVVNEIYSQYLSSIIELCDENGDDPNLLIEEIQTELREMVSQMIKEDEILYERKRAELTAIRSRYQTIFHQLHPEEICPDYEKSQAVLLALRTYSNEYDKLEEQYQQFLQHQTEIRREEKLLCEELGEISLQYDATHFLNQPLISQISLLSQHIEKLKDEKTRRLSNLSDIRRILNEYEQVYGWKRPPSETIINRLLTVEEFPLTKEIFDQVEKEFSKITEQIRKTETCFEQSNRQLAVLRRTHQSLTPNSKVLALSNNKQCRISKLPDLLAEVDRYKDYAMEKLTRDICKARERIHQILNKLSMGDTVQNSKYEILYINDFSEDIYFMHEELLQELESQYEMNKSIYEQIEHWNEIFLEFHEFEKNASDPQRFHRRGYSALTEEKTRKKLESTLRECEIRLQQLAEEYSIKNNGKVFLMNVNGKEIVDYLQQRKDEYLKNKEATKTPNSKKKGPAESVARLRPTPLQSVPGSDENNNFSEDTQSATTLCVPLSKTKKKFLFN